MMGCRLIYFVNILLILMLRNSCCFHVEFRHNHDIKIEPSNTRTFKRDILQKLDKASYSFNGFQQVNSVPVIFPLDICLMNLNDIQYAAVLHINKNGMRNFAVFSLNNDNYNMIAEIVTPLAIAMDCRSIADVGYVALAYNITNPVDNAREGSPVYQIKGNRIRAIQYFPTPNLTKIFLLSSANDLYMLQTFKQTTTTANIQCPYFKWSGTSFNILGRIPCSNARHLEAFAIDYEVYVAVANYADQHGRTNTDSEIYKYDRQSKKFTLFQRIRTNGAVDIKYFHVPLDDGDTKRQHFLVVGNSISSKSSSTPANMENVQGADRNLEADSVFYMYDKGQFVPYQKLSFYNVEQFLPIRSSNAEKFLLLVACKDQDIKIFNLNDWKFEESTVQLSEGALGRGVSKMRIFTTPTESYLVVANELMVANETNIYLPIFKQDEKANLLKQEMIEWTKLNIERLTKIDVEKLKQDVELKLAEMTVNKAPINVNEIQNSNIQIAKTKSLFYPRLKLSNSYWKALSYAKQALDLLEVKMQESAVREKRASHARVRQILKAAKTTEYEFEELNVGTLFVSDKLRASNINGYKPLDSELRGITAKKVIVTGRYERPEVDNQTRSFSTASDENDSEQLEDVISLNNLQISGKLNEFTWNELINNTLKRQGTIQFLKAPVSLDQLEVETIAVTSDEISGQNLSKLISIDGGGKYVVNQAIQFSAPIKAKNLIIHERLNNIHVHKNRLDVLLKGSNETQVIKGSKILESIKLMEPRKLTNQVMEQNLLGLASNTIIPDSLTLNGDFTIMGDVTISNLLTANNIVVGSKPKLSMKAILDNGLRMDQPLENVNINFEHPLVVNNSIVSFINAQDVQMLVKTGKNEIQVVEGTKLFKAGLEIKQGFSEVKNLNGINIDELEKRLFQRSTNQTIAKPMHFGKIVVKSINAPQLTLNAINLTDYLTKSGTQHIQAKLKVDKLTANTLHVDDLHINGKIFDTHLAEIYQQKAKNVPHKNIFEKNRKYQGSIYVRNLKINSTINGISVDLLESHLEQLNGNIKYVGDIKFNYDMRISNLTFYGKFNGIPAAEFGQCWLQKHGEQSFMVPQTLSSVECERGVLMKGRLNGYKAEEFITDTYWINRNEHITSAIFENPIQLQGALMSKTVNDISIPHDMLYRNSAQSQRLTQPITVLGDLFVQGHISNITTINNLILRDLDNFLKGYGADTLYVENANFAYQPEYETLNHHNLQNTLDDVWLGNENIVLDQDIEISDGYFEGLLEVEGPINNIDPKYLRDNYFSLSSPQEISTGMVFTNDVKFENDFNAEELHLFGPVKDSQSKSQFFFDDFVSNTMKKSGPHNIGGQWSLLEAIIEGDLNNVLVNKLNLATDVVRNDVELNEITAPKSMHGALIQKLYAAPNSLLNSVNVAKWIEDTVFVYENYTISGTTVLDTVNMYNDLQVDGNVNNVSFDESTLLLREPDQVLRGPVRIFNSFPQQQRILANNIENLWVDAVNDWSVEQFYANRAKFGPTAQVQGALIFSNPLQVAEFYGDDDGNVYQDGREKRRTSDDRKNTITSYSELEQAVQSLRKSFAAPNYVLKDFEVRQVLNISSKKLISLPLRHNDEFIDVIGVSNEFKESSMQFFSWNNTEQEFVANQNLSWLLHDYSLDALGLALQRNTYLKVERVSDKDAFQHSLVNEDAQALQMMLQKKNSKNVKITRFRRQKEDCFAVFSNSSQEVTIYCLKQSSVNSTLHLTLSATIKRAHVKQILDLSTNLIAILYEHTIEIWNTTNFTVEPLQRIDLVKPKQLAIGFKGNNSYLAVICEVNEKSMHFGTVEIYSFINNLSFVHVQTIDCVRPVQIEFAAIHQSDDLLLLILSERYDQPLVVYQYKGVAGFEQIVAASSLPTATRMQHIQLRSTQQHLIALSRVHEITFLEILLKRI